MIGKDSIERYKPQRTFLVQGTVAQFEHIVSEMEETFAIVHTLNVPRFTVDHAMSIAAFALEGDGTERICVAYFSVFSPDAAQVLLKSLEEPAALTTIIFVTPYPYTVPMTIRSRVTLLQSERAQQVVQQLNKAQALEYVKNELSSDSEDDAATRRANAVAFLDQLESQFKADPDRARTIYEAKHMLFRANMPTKFVMEYVVSVIL